MKDERRLAGDTESLPGDLEALDEVTTLGLGSRYAGCKGPVALGEV